MTLPRAARISIGVLLGVLVLALIVLLVPVRYPMTLLHTEVTGHRDSVTVAAGARYQANGLHRFLLGREYRELWSEPITVEVLDLQHFEGGLSPTEEGGGMQTRSLHFRSAAGRRWLFRSVDKEPTRTVSPLVSHGLIAWMLQDQTSSSHPASALVAALLQKAVGLPYGHPRLVLLPSDSLLGSYQSRFAGVLGTLQESPGELVVPPVTDTMMIRDTHAMIALLDSVPGNRADSRAFLTARLLDFFMNDWDRHSGQWRWAGSAVGGDTLWRPIPVDRDQAFSWYDGLLMDIARIRSPKLANFGPTIPPLRGLTRNSDWLDRRLLAAVPKQEWDSVTGFVTGQLSDSVIDEAVRAMPARYWELSGPMIAATLKARRPQLVPLSEAFFRQTHDR